MYKENNMIDNLRNERFEILLEDVSNYIFKFYGMIDIKNSFEVLDPYLHKVHNYIIDNNIKEITFDFNNLQFLNSSGIKSLINFISLVKSSPFDKHYIIKIELNKSYSWQMDCFKVISILAPDIVKFK